jgi:molybdopterin-guanine dinucleotide biosynthesis protein A
MEHVRDAYTAVVLVGGGATRLGGVNKPGLQVAGVPMIDRVLQAVRNAEAVVLVGPDDALPRPRDAQLRRQISVVRENPPGGGPLAAVAAAFQILPKTDLTAVVAGDLPLLTSAAIQRLRESALDDGAVFVDDDGREQWLCGLWRTASVRRQLLDIEPHGAPMRRLFRDLSYARVRSETSPPPWFDCDTEEDIKRAEEWLSR